MTRGSVNRKIFWGDNSCCTSYIANPTWLNPKELTVAVWFGAADCLDAFLIAFLLPTFLINMAARSFDAAFVLTFIRVMHEQGLKAAQDLFSSILVWSIGLITVISNLLAFFVPYYLPVFRFRILFFCFFEVPAVGLVLLTRLGTRSSSAPASPPGYPGDSMPVPQGSPPPPMAPAPGDVPGPAGPPETGLEPPPPSDPSEDRSD